MRTIVGDPAAVTSPAGGAAAPGRRLRDVDALRGFALLGIVVVNSTYFASTYHGNGLEDPAFAGAADQAVRWLVAVAFETKFFLLFSFLFGYSFTLQMASAERRGVAFRARFLRRLAGLYAIGLVHAAVLFPGDILTTYALLGLVLLAARNVPSRKILRATGWLLGLTVAAYLLLALAIAVSGSTVLDAGAVHAEAQRSAEALRGGPGSVIGEHLRGLPDVALLLAFFQAPVALAAFALGLVAGRGALLADVERRQDALRRIQRIGFPIGLVGGAIYAVASLRHPDGGFQVAALGLDLLTAPALAAAYAATVLRAFHGRGGERLSSALAPAGRMALSNYLLQSLVCGLLFTGLGFGLVGRVGPAAVLAIALAIFAGQLVVSRWWLRRHVYGPLEWGLRALTNLERPAWRRRADAADATPPGGR